MLEGNISSLLSSTLSKVFDEKCLTKDNMESDLLNGQLRYFNLEIKKSCLDSMSVPIGVVRGVVKSLSVQITRGSIFSNDPFRIIVEDLCLIVEPIDNYPIEDSIRNYYNAKLSEINVAEVKRQLQKALLTKEEGGKDEGGFFSGLLRNIVKNLEITLQGIHLRYEDHLSDTPFFCFGVVIDSLTFNSLTDLRLDNDMTYKQLSIKSSKIYFNNTLDRNWEDYSLLEMIDLLKLPDEGNINLMNIPDLSIYIASIKKNYDLEKPDQSIFIQVPHIELSLSHTQYYYIMHTNDFFTWAANRDNYSVIRKEVLGDECKNGDVIADKPRLLWKYGIKCIIRNIRKMKCSYNRDHLSSMWKHGQQYCTLYRKKLELEEKNLHLSKEDEEAYIECENILPTPTILLWRSYVEKQLAEISEPPSLKQSILSFFYPSSSSSTEPEIQDPSLISVEDLNYETLPSNYIKTKIRLCVNEIKFRLIADNALVPTSHTAVKQVRKNEKVLCCLFLNDTTFTLQTGYGWWEISCGINNLALKDYTSNHQKLKYILQRNDDAYHYNDAKSYFDKRDVIQLRLNYGENLFIYCNLNNIDVYANCQSILHILSFFDLNKNTIVPPKQEKSISTSEVPRIFTIMTYLYTVHPSISISNLHLYLPEDASNVDSSLFILSIPEITFKDNTVKTELTEEEKDMIVLNNFRSSRLSVVQNTQMEMKGTVDETPTNDRVLVSCDIMDINVVLCDINDLYTDNHYIMNHKLKVLQNMNIQLLLAFPQLLEDHSPDNDVHVNFSVKVSPVSINLDYNAIRRIVSIIQVLSHLHKLSYDDTIVNILPEVPSAGFFTVSSSIFGNTALENQETLRSIFGDYVTSLDQPPTLLTSLSSSSDIPPLQPPPSSILQRKNSIQSDYQSVYSDGHESFHSLVDTQDQSFMDDDFHSITDTSSIISGNKHMSDSDSFSSLPGDSQPPLSSLRDSYEPSPSRRRNSVFSITSATHSLIRSDHRNQDLFVSIGGEKNEKGDDYRTVVESEINDNSSLSTLSSKKRRMNLNFSVFDVLPIDFPMFDLDNIHPYYLSIKPEVLVIEMTVQFDSIKVTLTENNTDKNTHGVAVVLNSLKFESSHTLMTRLFDASLHELAIVPIYSNDFYNYPEVLNDFKLSPLYMTSEDKVITLSSTYYMPQSVLSGKAIYLIQLGLFNVTVGHSLYDILDVVSNFWVSFSSSFESESKSPSQVDLSVNNSSQSNTSVNNSSSQSLTKQSSPNRDIDFHLTMNGIDCKVYDMNINPKEHDCDESICYLHLFFNTFAMNIQKKEGVDISGSLQNCILELYDGKEDTYIVFNQLETDSNYDIVNLIEFHKNENLVELTINQIHILINPSILLQSIHSILMIMKKLPLDPFFDDTDSILIDSSEVSRTNSIDIPSNEAILPITDQEIEGKKIKQYNFVIQLNQPLIEFVVNDTELVCFDCSVFTMNYNSSNMSLSTEQFEFYSLLYPTEERIDYCSNFTGLFALTTQEELFYRTLHIEVDTIVFHCYPMLFSLCSSCLSLISNIQNQVKELTSSASSASSSPFSHSNSAISYPKPVQQSLPIARIEVQINSFYFNIYNTVKEELVLFNLEGCFGEFTITEVLNGKLMLQNLSLVTNQQDRILISRTLQEKPLLVISIDNQVVTTSLSSLSIIIPSTLAETIFTLLSIYQPCISTLLSSLSSTSNETTSVETPSNHSPSRFKQILNRILLLYHSYSLEQYYIKCNLENCDLSLCAVKPDSLENIQFNINCSIRLSVNECTCYSIAFQFYFFTIGLSNQLIKDHSIYYESSQSLVETGLSFSIVFNNNITDKSRRIRISTSLDEVDLIHILDTNNNNAIVLNLNAIQDVLSILPFILNSFSIFSSLSCTSSSTTSVITTKQLSSFTDCLEVCFPAVVLRYSLYNSIYFFISIENLTSSLMHSLHENHITCDFDTSIQYEMNSPLQSILNKIAIHAEVNSHEQHFSIGVSIDRDIIFNFPSSILVAINHNRNNKNRNDSSSYSIIHNNTSVDIRIEGEDKNGNKEFICLSNNQLSSKKYNFSKFNFLILTLNTPFGSYLPCRIPVQNMITNHQSDPEQSEIVNFSIQPDTTLESNLEELFTIPEKQESSHYRRLLSLLQSHSINVKYWMTQEEGIMEICSTSTIENHLDIPVYIIILFGHSQLFSHRIDPFSSLPIPPYAYLLSHLRIIIIPIITSIDEQLLTSSFNQMEVLSRLTYSFISIGVSGIQDGLYKCTNQNNLHEVEADGTCYLHETPDSFYMFIKLNKGSNSTYSLSLSAPITLVNQLPTTVAFSSSFECNIPSGSSLSFYDLNNTRMITLTPPPFTTKNALSINDLCGTAIQALENHQLLKVDEVKTSFECRDANQNPVILNCLIHWEQGAIQLCFYVPFWLVNLTKDPLQFKSSMKESSCLLPNQINYSIAEKTQYYQSIPIHGLECLCKQENEILYLNHDNSLLLRGPHTFWSSSIPYQSLSTQNPACSISLTDRSSLLSAYSHVYYYILDSSCSPYPNTTVLSLLNQFVIYNNTQTAIEIKQVDTDDMNSLLLSPFQSQPLQFFSGYNKEFVLRVVDSRFSWSSSSIPIFTKTTKDQSFLVYCKDNTTNKRLFFEVLLQRQYNGCVNFIINETPYDENNLPVIFNNHTLFPIVLQQKDCTDQWFIPPFKIIPFYWCNLALSHQLQVTIYNRGSNAESVSIPLYEYLLNCNQNRNRILLKFTYPSTGQSCQLIMSTEILRNRFVISIKHLSSSSSPNHSFTIPYEGHFTEVIPSHSQSHFHITMNIPALHLTLLNTIGHDLLCLSLQSLSLQLQLEERKDIVVAVQSIQLDNQNTASHYPVVLISQGNEENSAFQFHCILQEEETVDFGNCWLVSLAEVNLHPIYLVLEGSFIEECLHILKEVQTSNSNPLPIANKNKPHSIADLLLSLEESRSMFISNYPYKTYDHSIKPLLSHRQIYEESRHIRIKKLQISSIEIHLSLCLGTVFSSWYYDYYTIQDLPLVLSPILLHERYPRRISSILSQIKSLYIRTCIIQIPRLLGSLKIIGNPTRVLTELTLNLQTLFTDCISSFTSYPLHYAIPSLFQSIYHYIDRNLTSFSLILLDSFSSFLSCITMLFQFLHSSIQPFVYHGEITQSSPYLQNPKKGLQYLPYMFRQSNSLLLHLLYSFSSLSYPLQYFSGSLQRFRAILAPSVTPKQRIKSPNLCIDHVLLTYDEVYSKGREIMAVVNEGIYKNEDIISVYSFTHYNLLVTRNRFLLISVRNEEYSVKCDIRFENCMEMHKIQKEDGNVDLCFTCLKQAGFSGSFYFSNSTLFGMQLEEKKIPIGKGHAALRVADMLCEIIEKEMINHDNLWKCCYSLNTLQNLH